MAIQLFEHNQTAYESAVSLLDETGKAAIVHPTGTGKSFIGFKLCEDNPESTVCWLSPSSYIFETQIENLKKVSGGYAPENVQFFTYAKLMLMTEEELLEIQPDYIILDEFHRCGAEMWGQGVQNLLTLYSDTPVLGLSATNIRYLDNQRDMADELFDGNIASEITLGEAIVRGILNPPKYVLSIFSYQKDLERYKKRVETSRNKAVRDAAEKYLEALRRALEMADGLDVIFDRHMKDRTGKYIVFCANAEHMQEMMDMVPEWFSKIDKDPHIYSVYSSDPSASQSFRDFKEDSDPAHMKLLFCIDALNEGIHVEGVSGVILLRPTVSPIIYKQQIGRALSAASSNDAVIWDIVNNIESIYSIGAIEEEMLIATTYYRSLGESDAIVNERFKVIDEVRSCRELFERLNDTLSAPWNVMYGYAKAYFEEHGNLEISSKYKTEDGYSLGQWVFAQRAARKGQTNTVLTDDRIAKLDAIGMIWDNMADVSWERNFGAAKAFYQENGHLDMPVSYVTEDGIALGQWFCSLRTWLNAGAHPKYLTPERKAQLDEIGMIWDKLNYFWEQNYLAACAYYKEHGNLDVPSAYISEDGVRLGHWLNRLRALQNGIAQRGTPPTEEQIARLDAIGMNWGNRLDVQWEKAFQEARRYFHKNKTLKCPTTYMTSSGFLLGNWLTRQRSQETKGKLSPERKQKLDTIGMRWGTDPWMQRYEQVKAYYEEHGNLDISQNVAIDGFWMGKWIFLQTKLYFDESSKLTAKQRQLLSELPLSLKSHADRQWNFCFEEAKKYLETHGALKPPAKYVTENGCRLSPWLTVQRRRYKQGELSEEQIRKLESIGFEWELDSRWIQAYRRAEAYYQEHGDLKPMQAYKCKDGYCLGAWLGKQRSAYQEHTLSQSRIAALERIGMVWEPEKPWDISYRKAMEYYRLHHSLPERDTAETEDDLKTAIWLDSQRQRFNRKELTQQTVDLLNKIGMNLHEKTQTPWEIGYEKAKAYYEEHGDLNVSSVYQCEDGYWLGSWIFTQTKKKDSLSKEQIQALDAIGIVWQKDSPWEIAYQKAVQYYQEFGNLPLLPAECQDKETLSIYTWLKIQRAARKKGKLTDEQIQKLNSINMEWLNAPERAWEAGFCKAKAYHEENGTVDVPVAYVCSDGYPLGQWIHTQRKDSNKLSTDRKERLDAIGMIWRKKNMPKKEERR